MRFSEAIESYIRDMKTTGRIRSAATERSYRGILSKHGEDVDNRDPHAIGRLDIKRTLTRWAHPNTQRTARSILVSFYDWTVEEGIRPYNPARQTRRPRKVPSQIYRFTKEEAAAMLAACHTQRERRCIYIGVCAGLRRKELLGLQGRHFHREDFVWVSADIGKGGRERWVPVIPDLEAVVAEIRQNVASDEYVLPAQRFRDPGVNREKRDYLKRPASPQAIYYLVKRVGKRAEISADIGPHTLRHAFADHVTRTAGVHVAQAMLGHSDLGTTQAYLGGVSLDELRAAVAGVGFAIPGYPPAKDPASPDGAMAGTEPVDATNRPFSPVFAEFQDRAAAAADPLTFRRREPVV